MPIFSYKKSEADKFGRSVYDRYGNGGEVIRIVW